MSSSLIYPQKHLNNPPENDEIELSLFGSGYGESILIHTGNNEWSIIDSCYSKGIDIPSPLYYLNEINVDLYNVKSVTATHWDDDHIRGLSTIVEKCTNSKFIISAAINDPKFVKLVVDSPLSQAISLGQQSKTGITEFNLIYNTLKNSGRRPDYAIKGTIIWNSQKSNHDAKIISLSPHPEVFDKAIKSIISQIPSGNSSIGSIKPPKTNYTSIVLWVNIGKDRLLLGADMEESSEYKGWTLLLEDKSLIDKKAQVYKVAHHGSETGDHDKIWSDLLEVNPICVIAPWKGNRLPSQGDIDRIKQSSNEIYISHYSEDRKVKSDKKVVKRLLESKKARYLFPEFSMIRLRKKIGNSKWKIECFGNAEKII